MVQQVKSYAAEDGKRFDTFEAAAIHEIGLQIAKERPDIKSSLSIILRNAAYLATVLKPLAPTQKRPPRKVLDHPVKRAAYLGSPVLRAVRGGEGRLRGSKI